jgi:hypothetical protein
MTTGPKLSRGTLDIINNTYVVRNGMMYEYYPIICTKPKEQDKFFDIEISPGIMAEGIAIIDRRMYNVSLRDLQRRRINVGNLRTLDNGKRKGTKGISTESGSKTIKEDNSEPGRNEQRLGEIVGDKVGKVADMAWQNQVDSLLETLHTEEGEEFEVTGTTQSRQADENSPIPDIFEDPIED